MELLDCNVIQMLKKVEESTGKNLIAELYGLFAESTPEQIVKMRGAFSDQNFEELKVIAHTLKSSCGNIGAKFMSSRSAEIESHIHHQVMDVDIELLDRLLVELEESFQQTLSQLGGYA